MSKRKSDIPKDNNISSKLLGTNISDINIEKFRDLTGYKKHNYQLQGKFTIPILKNITNKFSPQIMFTITLPNQAISSIDALEECENLMILNLSRNSIENLRGLRNAKKLRIIDFSDNSINNIDALQGAVQLVNAHFQGNLIKGLENLKALKSCTALKNLHLQNLSGTTPNPICGLNGYRNNIFDFLTQLRRLDSVPKGVQLDNGSELSTGNAKQIKIDLKNIGPFYTTKFPSTVQFTMPTFQGQTSLKKSMGSCRASIQQLELRMRAALAL